MYNGGRRAYLAIERSKESEHQGWKHLISSLQPIFKRTKAKQRQSKSNNDFGIYCIMTAGTVARGICITESAAVAKVAVSVLDYERLASILALAQLHT